MKGRKSGAVFIFLGALLGFVAVILVLSFRLRQTVAAVIAAACLEPCARVVRLRVFRVVRRVVGGAALRPRLRRPRRLRHEVP